MFKLIAFDFDLTLADASSGIIKCANYACEELGIPEQTPEAIRSTIGMTLLDTYTRFTGDYDKKAAEQYMNLFVKKADEIMLDETVLFPDTIKTLKEIKSAGIYTAVITTKFRYRIEQVIEKFEMQQLIDHVIGYEDVKKHKPDPEGLLMAADCFSVKPEEVLYVGDNIIDAQTAAAAGVTFIAVTTGTTEKSAFAEMKPFAVVPNLAKMMLTIKDWRRTYSEYM